MEYWKTVEGYENLNTVYEVSTEGRVRNTATGKILAQGLDLFGYPVVQFLTSEINPSSKRKVRKTVKVHRLLAIAFIPNPENKPTVNHKDGNKTNNTIDNLEWNTRHEQLQHAYDLGLKTADRGSSNVNAKLTDDQVRKIRSSYIKNDKSGFGSGKLAKKFGVEETTILNIIHYRTYKNVQ